MVNEAHCRSKKSVPSTYTVTHNLVSGVFAESVSVLSGDLFNP